MRRLRRLKSKQSTSLIQSKPSSSIYRVKRTPYGMGVTRLNKKENGEEGTRKRKKQRPYVRLILTEREKIYNRLQEGHSFFAIAKELNRTNESISKEVKKNGGRENYDPFRAQEAAFERRSQQSEKKSTDFKLKERIENMEMHIDILTEAIKELKRCQK